MLRTTFTRTALVLVMIGLLSAVLWTVVPTLGQTPPRDDYAPYGISSRDATKLTGEKAEMWRAEMERYERALANPGPPRPATPPFRPTPTPEPITPKLIEQPQPFCKCTFRNTYIGPHDGGFVQVWAGYDWSEPSRGVIYVDTGADPRGPRSRDWYYTPSTDGPLRIVSVRGADVELVSEDGGVHHFNLDSRAYSQAPAEERCCAVQLDLMRDENGIQAGSGTDRDVTRTVDIVLSPGVESLAAFSFKLVYDDTVLAGRIVGEGTARTPRSTRKRLGRAGTARCLPGLALRTSMPSAARDVASRSSDALLMSESACPPEPALLPSSCRRQRRDARASS